MLITVSELLQFKISVILLVSRMIAGADSGIGQAVAIAFAMEGADVVVLYNENDDDAETTRQHVEKHGRLCHLIKADVGVKSQCEAAHQATAAL